MPLRCLSLLLLAALVAAADVELALTSGRTVRGELVKDDDATVTIRLRSPVRGGVKMVEATYQRADIMRRKALPGLDQQYAERLKASSKTVPDLCVLAQWCYENCLREHAHEHAVQVLQLDGDNAWAKHILDNCGYILVADKWVDEDAYLKDTKQAKVDGQIMPADQAEARRSLDRAVTVRTAAMKRLASLQGVLKDKPAAVSSDGAKAQSAQAAYDGAKQAYDEGKKKYDEFSGQPLGKKETPEARQKKVNDGLATVNKLADKVTEAKRSLDTANRQLASDKGALDRANAQIAEAQATADKATAELKAVAAKLPADDAAAQAAPARLGILYSV